jgi:hypothetical protein
MRRRELLFLLGGIIATGRALRAQQRAMHGCTDLRCPVQAFDEVGGEALGVL